jgi:uncharacterized SAM-binding protein YcdF (DUF218 family)
MGWFPRQHGIARALRRFWLYTSATLFSLQILIAVFGFPASFVHWLTGKGEVLRQPPRHIVVLGGGGIPSETGLIRTYYAAEYGRGVTGVTFVVALPADGDPDTSSVGRMRDELVMRGVERRAIRMEYRGWNTHEQAVNTRTLLGHAALAEPLLVVTSPSHARRSLLCFRKAGFRNAACLPAVITEAEANAGRRTLERYRFWSALAAEAQFTRELCALAYYKLRGWI